MLVTIVGVAVFLVSLVVFIAVVVILNVIHFACRCCRAILGVIVTVTCLVILSFDLIPFVAAFDVFVAICVIFIISAVGLAVFLVVGVFCGRVCSLY